MGSIRNHFGVFSSDVKRVWRNVDCVCFDVDSTVCKNEAIDDLARFMGVGEEVEKMTRDAMGGNVTFKESLTKRLSLIKPTLEAIDEFNRQQMELLTPGIKELIELLHSKNIAVYLISGGFRLTIYPVADALNIDRKNVFANTLLFDSLGNYIGFDENEYTCESGGKGKVINMIKKKFNYKNVVMIGDGATDLESSPPADAFIGFGGNVVREKVKQNSKWFVYDFNELINDLIFN